MLSRREFLLRTTLATLIASAGIFTAVRLATAGPGGPTHPALTYSGVLRDAAPGMHTLAFTFQKGATSCGPISVMAQVGAGGAFSAEVPLTLCPAFFDGADVTYTVSENGTALTDGGVRITPVPYARFADQAGVNYDCPPGYSRDVTAPGFDDAMGNLRRLCRKRLPDATDDEVVRVGTPPTVFWIDRYEASVISSIAPYARAFESDTTTPALPRNGAWRLESRSTPEPLTAPFLSRSVHSVAPARWVTWFQAMELCRMSGKRLPTGEEWLTAAMGTNDPGDNDGSRDDRCNTGNGSGGSSPLTPRNAGNGAGCRSHWGAQDMIGNVWERTAEWYAGVGNQTGFAAPGMGTRVNDSYSSWPDDYGDDRTWNVNAVVVRAPGDDNRVGIHSTALRGGSWFLGTRAGVYSLNLNHAPSSWSVDAGFRCVLRR